LHNDPVFPKQSPLSLLVLGVLVGAVVIANQRGIILNDFNG